MNFQKYLKCKDRIINYKSQIMKTCTFLLLIFTFSHITSQNNNSSFSFTYELTEDIANTELSKYSKARDYLKQDSLFCGENIYFSPYLADLDFFYFEDAVIGDSILNGKLFFKSRWFEDYYSSRLDSIMGKQFVKYDYIAFFSLVENEMLRVDVFLKRKDISSLRFHDVALFSGGGTHAFLFDFEKSSDNIRNVIMIEMIYD